ncbi:MAG: YihY family inner membrane protein [Nitrospinae bacterium]|nr:YihY family inner membrane protein [Nitrospinota bacterium]
MTNNRLSPDNDKRPKTGAMRTAGRLLYEIAEKFWNDSCPTYAASLAYTTLLALAPLAAISLSVITSFDFSRDATLRFVFERVLPNPELAMVIEKNINTFARNAASVSIFGVISLALLGVWVMSTVESSFNMIWRVGRSRPLFSQFVAYWSALTFSPVLIAASVIVTASVHSIVMSRAWAEYSYAQGFVLKFTPYALTWAAFFLIYKLIPYTTVNMAPAWAGAITAGTLFELAKLVFNYYLRNFANYTEVYGALAILPTFLLWLYVTWLIILLGSVIAYAIQYPKEMEAKEAAGGDKSGYITYYSLLILAESARRFNAGAGPLSPEDAMIRFGVTAELYRTIAGKLEEGGFVSSIEGESGKFLPARPPDEIRVADVISHVSGGALETPPFETDDGEMPLLFATARRAIGVGLEGMSVVDLSERLDRRDVEPAD